MAGRRPKSAREIAVEVLERCDPRKSNAGSMLERLLDKTEQRQRATDLVFGTLRDRQAIDTVIVTFSGRAVERIQDKLLAIIRVGVYELVYRPATEVYAVVNEAVELAKATTGKRQAGFVNAVLRQIIRHISHRENPLSEAATRRTLVQAASSGCEFDTDFLPDREAHPSEYLSTVFSLPQWLIRNWLDTFGEEVARQICLASNRRPGITIRPNRLRTTIAALSEKLRQAGIELQTSSEELLIAIDNPRAISQLPGFTEGEFVVQDATASRPVQLLNPQPEWSILDLCAAPGVKTTQLAEATRDLARIVATDISPHRLERVRENVTRLGVKSVEIVSYEELGDSKFDCVLLDVPCSNTGVLAKRVEARYRVSPDGVRTLTKIQRELLSDATARLKPNGRICYSTCSVQECENGGLVREFLMSHPDFELECEELILPSVEQFDHDGGYTAILVRP
ncbi:MAG: transcription antitermination factor NusB [Sedimentisphaerales bacterium]|jgi:16S rRNA (cytosine967-C5)-methyltransferase